MKRLEAADIRARLPKTRRLVVKVGSALLAPPKAIYGRLAKDIAAARAAGCEVVLVTSGAIALGLGVLGQSARPKALAMLQAAAAAGQPKLMRRWHAALRRFGVPVAQVLLTHADLADRERFLNARRALLALLACGALPVVNENDSVATDEIRVGDNDQLSAHVATLIDAELLVILTSVDGLYDGNPENDPRAQRLPTVHDAKSAQAFAGRAGKSGLGVGGMRTKVLAANAATHRATATVIASGKRRQPLGAVLSGADVGTLFVPDHLVQGRKHWIAYTLRPRGCLRVDAGAAAALSDRGKSLLPGGLTAVEGHFPRGSMVDIVGPKGLIARGLVAYDHAELALLQGHKSGDIARLIGYIDTPEIVHRDDLVLIRATDAT